MSTNLATVATKPGHARITDARTLGAARYSNTMNFPVSTDFQTPSTGCRYVLRSIIAPTSSSSVFTVSASVPVMYALFVAVIIYQGGPEISLKHSYRCCMSKGQPTVIVRAELNIMIDTTTADIFQERRTALLSCLSGQKRSKKNADPKMVATATPTKILYEAAPTKLLLLTEAPGCCFSTADC